MVTAADPLRAKALAVLRGGRLTVLKATADGGEVVNLLGRVQSSRTGGGTYAVDLLAGRWTCTCRGWQQANACPHLLAAQMVSGHAGGDS